MLGHNIPNMYELINLGLLPKRALWIIYGIINNPVKHINQWSNSKKYINMKYAIKLKSINMNIIYLQN